MSKLATLIMKSRYPHRNKIKINYKTQSPIDLMLDDKIKKNIKKNIKNNLSQFRLTR